jgi:two-component system chemotaxis sensor kinase CheA
LSDFDRDLLEIFSAEQAEHIQRIRVLAESFPGMPVEARPGTLEEILRRAHTLKGASRAVGLKPTEDLAHQLEALFLRAQEQGAGLDDASLSVIHRALDAMEDILAAAVADRPAPDITPILESLVGQALPPAHLVGQALPPVQLPSLPASESPVGQAFPPANPEPPAAAEYVRVNAATIDTLIRASSQLVVSVSAESAAAQHSDESYRRAAQAYSEFQSLRRACNPYLRAHEEDIEATPLRECLEFVDRELRVLTSEARSASAAQHHRGWELGMRVTELHQTAVRVRMIPAESVFGAFGAMARQVAQDEGKELEFRAEGLDVQADRLVLQALKDPVMHLLRNAVSHGIETPEVRTSAGKPPEGSVRLRIDARGGRLDVIVEDDGRGLDVAAVRDRAVALGLLSPRDAAAESPQELAKLIFRPGFSTAETITSISGRGIGLSVVSKTVDRLQGDIQVRPRSTGGLRVIISVALSISTQQLLLLESGGSVFGLPARLVRLLTRVRLSALQTMEGREVLVVDGRPAPLARLSDLLGVPGRTDPVSTEDLRDPWVSIACLTSGEQLIGLIVDRFLDEREAIVKDLGLPGNMTGMTAGGIPLEDGRVALLLNPPALFQRFRDTSNRQPLRKPEDEADKVTHRILVVDDSLTTRSLEKSILEAHGFQVSIAVDGIDALEKLRAEKFHLVITDVMMPRMDGMQLLEQMKKQKSTESIPVIMVTSMESKDDQERGMSLGADAYIVKRKFDQQELLRTVRQIL